LFLYQACFKVSAFKIISYFFSEEDFYKNNIFLIGCIPDFPIERNWGCRNCDAAFFKDTPRNKTALGGIVPHQWPKE
jgi:hypothetical protein